MASEDVKIPSSPNIDNTKAVNVQDNAISTNPPKGPPAFKPIYSALSAGRRRFILWIVTAAGFFGPLAGGIYLPALPTLQDAFHTSATAINATVSVFMGVLAVAVRTPFLNQMSCCIILNVVS